MQFKTAMTLWLALATGTLSLVQEGGSQTRTWKDSTGHFTIEAALAGLEGNQVRLKKTDGTVITLTADKLSAADQEYLAREREPRELKHDDGKPAGKKSIAGSGHAVAFDAPGEGFSLTSIRLHGARYGYPAPPREDFHVWVCDAEGAVLAEHGLPYRLFERSNPQWVTLRIPPTRVPAKFVVGVGFNPEATKGVYVSHDVEASGKSSVGLPSAELRPFEGGDWMIRAVVERKAEASARKTTN